MADKKRKSVGDTSLAKKRRTITLEMKVEIIKCQEKGGTLSQIALAYGVNR
jgi:transposase-like protein